MPVHSIHVFDRKGKTLYTRKFAKDGDNDDDDDELLAEQRKLVFGMLFSLGGIASSLAPTSSNNKDVTTGKLQSIKTPTSTLYTYLAPSGLRLALYIVPPATSGTKDNSNMSKPLTEEQHSKSIPLALQHVYQTLWIECVTRSPLYDPVTPNVPDTNFGEQLQTYLANQPWFR